MYSGILDSRLSRLFIIIFRYQALQKIARPCCAVTESMLTNLGC